MADEIRLMRACTTCLSGAHLPVFAAEGHGVFEEHGLNVEVVTHSYAPWNPEIPDHHSLRHLSGRLGDLVAGDVDFALIPVAYVLSAKHKFGGELPVRFVACFHQRFATAAVVRDDSEIGTAADLAGRTAARRTLPWLVREYEAALEHHGLGQARIIDPPSDADPTEALARGELDVIPIWMDLFAYFSDPQIALRAIALDVEVYGTGLIAGDHVPLEVVQRMRDAIGTSFLLQLEQPEPGIEAFRRRFPDITASHISFSWSLFERYAFGRDRPGSMDPERWKATMEYLAAVHSLSVLPLEQICRPELLADVACPLAEG